VPTKPDDLDIVQVIKQEWSSLGGGEGSDYPSPNTPLSAFEDAPEVPALFIVESGRRNKIVAIWTHNGDLKFRDVANPGTNSEGYTLTDLLASSSGITAPQHRVLPQLIHFIDEGPAFGYVSGATKTVTGGLFPTKVEWKRQDDTLLIEKTIERSAGGATNLKPTPIVWKLYDTDGTTVLETVSDAVTYDGIHEAGRTRTIS